MSLADRARCHHLRWLCGLLGLLMRGAIIWVGGFKVQYVRQAVWLRLAAVASQELAGAWGGLGKRAASMRELSALKSARYSTLPVLSLTCLLTKPGCIGALYLLHTALLQSLCCPCCHLCLAGRLGCCSINFLWPLPPKIQRYKCLHVGSRGEQGSRSWTSNTVTR